MIKWLLILGISMLLLMCELNAQRVSVMDFDEFQPLLEMKNDTTYVINFWATWCIPCIKELPEFERINKDYRDKKFKMILVSLDFRSQMDEVLIPYLKEKQLTPEVLLLSDPNSNVWINKVNPDWSGSIPATVIYNSDYYYFHEGSMDFNTLNKIITKNIKL
ncbi:MAG: TlpA family protein disulfide reductase [Bacteroidales bacterium]|jgi:thiol-disulfide isomerase/thioredoxin